jgi:hypothetical protein
MVIKEAVINSLEEFEVFLEYTFDFDTITYYWQLCDEFGDPFKAVKYSDGQCTYSSLEDKCS